MEGVAGSWTRGKRVTFTVHFLKCEQDKTNLGFGAVETLERTWTITGLGSIF